MYVTFADAGILYAPKMKGKFGRHIDVFKVYVMYGVKLNVCLARPSNRAQTSDVL
jgi:hypothetical protein